MKNKFILILFVAMTFLTSSKCRKEHDDKFSIIRMPYIGNDLKIDGYYYQEKDGYYYISDFFYRNGILLYHGGRYTLNELKDMESNILNGVTYQKAKENKYCWGLFRISSTNIQYERYYNTDAIYKKAYVMSGDILNDTTFHITKSWRSGGGEEKSEDATYHFKKFSTKPDSTNSFVP